MEWSTEVMSFFKLIDYFQLPTERIPRFSRKSDNGKHETIFEQQSRRAETKEDFELIFKRELGKKNIPRLDKAEIEIEKIGRLVEKCGSIIRESEKNEDFFHLIRRYINYLKDVIGKGNDTRLSLDEIKAIYKHGDNEYWNHEEFDTFSKRFTSSIEVAPLSIKYRYQISISSLLILLRDRFPEVKDYEDFVIKRFGINGFRGTNTKNHKDSVDKYKKEWSRVLDIKTT